MSKRRRNSGTRSFEEIMEVKRSALSKSSLLNASDEIGKEKSWSSHSKIPLSKADITLHQAMESFEKSEEADLYLQHLLKNNFQEGKEFQWSINSGKGEEITVCENKAEPVEIAIEKSSQMEVREEDKSDSTIEKSVYWDEDALFSDQMLVLYLRLRHENQLLRNQKQTTILREYENVFVETEHLLLLLNEYSKLEKEAELELKSKVGIIRKGIEKALTRQKTVLQQFEKKYSWLSEQLKSQSEKPSHQMALFEAVLDEIVPEKVESSEPINQPVRTATPVLSDEEDLEEIPAITMDNRLTLRGSSLHGRESDPVPGRPMVNNVPLLMVDDSQYTDWHHYLYPQKQATSKSAGKSHIIVKALAGGNDSDAACYMIEFVRTGKRILVDAGMRLLTKGDRFPNFSLIPKPDLILITRAHYNHCAALPYLIKRWPEIPVWSSIETSHLLPVLLQTLIRDQPEWMQEASVYDKEEIQHLFIHTIPWGEKQYPFHDELAISFHKAGQLPGASSISLQSKTDSVFVTGDFALHDERICPPAHWPQQDHDIALMNITQGHYQKFARVEMEEILLDKVEEILRKGGTAVFPIGELGKESSLLALFKQGVSDGSLSKVPFYMDGRMPLCLKAIENTLTEKQSEEQVSLHAAHSLQWSYTEVNDGNRPQIGQEASCVFVNYSMLKEGAPGFSYFRALLTDPSAAIFLPSINDSFVSIQPELDQYWRKNMGRKAEILYYHWPSFSAQDELIKGIEAINAQVVLLVHGNVEAHRNMRTAVPGHVVRRSIANQETIRVRPQDDEVHE
jgi:Cft2 family RNA processing exonuclease